MPFFFDPDKCANCKYDHCLEDRRQDPNNGRNTAFLLNQQVALACTFGDFVPGSDKDPQPERQYFSYLQQLRSNIQNAGWYLFGEDFNLGANAIAKAEGDVFVSLEAATLWNAAATWNNFMDSGSWSSQILVFPKAPSQDPKAKSP